MSIKKSLFLISFTLTAFFGLESQEFPKCKEACDKYYNCTVQVNPNATQEQKDMLRKGCNFNCNKPKYYNQIAGCLTTSGATCKTFSDCIVAQMQTGKK